MLTPVLAHGSGTFNHPKKLVLDADSSGWTFLANSVTPQFSTSRAVNGNYTVSYAKNKLTVYLPYFGRAYAGTEVYPTKSPLDFTSEKFEITKRPAKKGGWIITIIPKDYKEVQSMVLTFFDNGYATLDVTMLTRTSISFYGNMEAPQ